MTQTQTQTTSSSSTNTYKMVTFNVPYHLVNNFDEVRKFKRVSRTSMLINLMEGFVRDEVGKLEKDNNINKLIMDMKLRNQNPSQPSFNKQTSKQYERWEDSYNDITPQPIFDDGIDDRWRKDLVMG
jgi:hypothetical protein